MHDTVRYAIGFGPLGELAHRLLCPPRPRGDFVVPRARVSRGSLRSTVRPRTVEQRTVVIVAAAPLSAAGRRSSASGATGLEPPHERLLIGIRARLRAWR